MTRLLPILSSLLLLSACGVPFEPEGLSGLEASSEYRAQRSSIIGGTVSTGDPAVVSISAGLHGQYCTGTLIGPKTVLTAAHCIDPYGSSYTYYVLFGTDSWNSTKQVEVAAQYKHPSYNQTTHDIGLLQLVEPVLDVIPIELNSTPITTADIGHDVRHVGFGVTDAATGSGSGTKRTVTTPLRQFDALVIESGATGKQTCNGDSGGPALMITQGSSLERVAGVVSYGDQNCAQFGVDGRVDADLTWLRNTFSAWEAPSCSEDGKCVAGCTPVDQDCVCATDGQCNVACQNLLHDADCPKDCVANGVCATDSCPEPDPDCVPVGGICGSDSVCQGRQCVMDPQHPSSYCSRTCASATDCPSDMQCVSAGVCLFRPKPPVDLGETCTAADYCVGGVCTGPLGGALRCAITCAAQEECPTGYSCEAGIEGQSYCRSPLAPVAPRNRPMAILNAEITAPAASGCSAAAGGPPFALALMALFGLLPRRSRSR